MKRTFTDMLQEVHATLYEVHATLYPTVLDDDGPDHFDAWLSELQADDFIKYGDFFGRERYIAGQQKVLEDMLSKK